MGLTGKWMLPLFGAVVLCGLVQGVIQGYDDVNSLPPDEKRRIIRELLRAQKDIRRALLKVHYSLNGEEHGEEGEADDEGIWDGCSDKELAGYRANLEEKMSSLSNGMQLASTLIEEIEHRIKPGQHGHYESGHGRPEYINGYGPDDGYGGGWEGGDYGHNGYEPGYAPNPRPTKPTRPPLTTTPETTSWRPTTPSYGTDDDDDYYARKRGANRHYGRELSVDGTAEEPVVEHDAPAPSVQSEDPSEDDEVEKLLEALVDDKE